MCQTTEEVTTKHYATQSIQTDTGNQVQVHDDVFLESAEKSVQTVPQQNIKKEKVDASTSQIRDLNTNVENLETSSVLTKETTTRNGKAKSEFGKEKNSERIETETENNDQEEFNLTFQNQKDKLGSEEDPLATEKKYPEKCFNEQELSLANDLIEWMENELVEEKSLIGKTPMVVSTNNTAKKREIFEVKVAKIENSVDRRKSVVEPKDVDKSKFDDSVDEIRDVLSRLRPSSNFPFVLQTIENLLVNLTKQIIIKKMETKLYGTGIII
jgi:hypothetical protein